jgi:hypothetical protein
MELSQTQYMPSILDTKLHHSFKRYRNILVTNLPIITQAFICNIMWRKSWASGLNTGESMILMKLVSTLSDFSLLMKLVSTFCDFSLSARTMMRQNWFCDQRTSANKVVLAIFLTLTVHRVFDEISRYVPYQEMPTSCSSDSVLTEKVKMVSFSLRKCQWILFKPW